MKDEYQLLCERLWDKRKPRPVVQSEADKQRRAQIAEQYRLMEIARNEQRKLSGERA